MREKKWKLVITFSTTTRAIAFERACHQKGQPGRLIPVPRELSPGCGMAWSAEVSQQSPLENFIKEEQLEIEEIVTVQI